ncbi:hypothetical protein, partial [Pradoshia sp.]
MASPTSPPPFSYLSRTTPGQQMESAFSPIKSAPRHKKEAGSLLLPCSMLWIRILLVSFRLPRFFDWHDDVFTHT